LDKSREFYRLDRQVGLWWLHAFVCSTRDTTGLWIRKVRDGKYKNMHLIRMFIKGVKESK
jgi:hypothetical protein